MYALGVILYELLTGRPPFDGPVWVVLACSPANEPPPPSEHRAGLAPALEAICLKAMAKKPDDRYASMSVFAAAVSTFLANGGEIATVQWRSRARSSTLRGTPGR